jgi:hypothetical protein
MNIGCLFEAFYSVATMEEIDIIFDPVIAYHQLFFVKNEV